MNAVVDDVAVHFAIDEKRVFFVGHSNGAFMSHRMGCDSAGKVAAIAAFAGDNWQDGSKCNPSEPVAALQIHGDADIDVPYDGTAAHALGQPTPSASGPPRTTARAACRTPGKTYDFDSRLAGNETSGTAWSCPVGAAELWTMHGGTHIPTFVIPNWGNYIFDWLMAHPKSLMRVGVYGAGSIGAYLGGRLSAAGVAVTLVVRAPRAAAMAAEGLRVSDFRGFDVTLPPAALTVATTAEALADCDCVLVTVKALDTAAAAAALAPVLGSDAIVVSLQNGVRNAEQLGAALAPRAVVAGMVGFNVLGKSQRHFHQATSGRLAIAQLSSGAPLPSGAPPPVAAALAAAGIPTDVERDLAPILWGKLLFNLNNAVNALAGVPLAEQLASRGYRRIMGACIREGHAVLERAGIAAKLDVPVPTSWIPPLMALPTPLFRLFARKMVAIDPSARSSMWEDLQRRRPTEIDLLNGEIVALGRAHGIATPFNARLIELVKSYENQPPPSLSAEVLWTKLTTV